MGIKLSLERGSCTRFGKLNIHACKEQLDIYSLGPPSDSEHILEQPPTSPMSMRRTLHVSKSVTSPALVELFSLVLINRPPRGNTELG